VLLDERTAAIHALRTASVTESAAYIYPALYSLADLAPNVRACERVT